MDSNDTIAVISTPIGSGAISIIRMSGAKALEIALKLFSSKNLTKDNITARMLNLGDIKTQNIVEKCLMVYFKAPYSYTGEDLVEFQCHGGEFLTKEILSACMENGARLAENGEFTKRAFLNGKMSLDKVEGVADIINATSSAETKAAYNLLNGDLYKKVKSMQNLLTEMIAKLDVTIDYPEHDDEQVTLESVKKDLSQIEKETDNLIGTQKQGGLIKYGIKIALVGQTNVGKSSLLNAILGQERAIVTEIEGTTRDIISETISYKDLKFNFIDTAGIRESGDKIEQIGIKKSKQSIEEADIVLFVIDGSRQLTNEEKELYKAIQEKTHLVVINKQDIIKSNYDYKNQIYVSALTGQGIEELKQKIYNMSTSTNIQPNQLIITNLRQIEALKECKKVIGECWQALGTNLTDIVAGSLEVLWKTLGKITGETENEEIIDKIFSKFCLGK